MNALVERIISEAAHLSGQDFKMLIIMASHARNNPPEYMLGRELVQEGMGWTPGSDGADKNYQERIRQLINAGYLKRTQRGGMFRYAAYEFAFPTKAIQP